MALLPAALAGTNARLIGSVPDEIIVEVPEEEATVAGASSNIPWSSRVRAI
jgi:hypothetical protein